MPVYYNTSDENKIVFKNGQNSDDVIKFIEEHMGVILTYKSYDYEWNEITHDFMADYDLVDLIEHDLEHGRGISLEVND